MSLTGVRYVSINGQKYDIQGVASTLEDVKRAAVEIDPGLTNADAVVEGDTVTFKFRSGTKGALITKAIYNGRTYEIDPSVYSSPQQIKDALTEVHNELVNADYVVNGDTMTFTFRSGTKGC